MKPRDALISTIETSLVACISRKPGAAVEMMPEEIRDALKELKSSDIEEIQRKEELKCSH
jgi:DNA-binding GntR family transcriptional regulator